MNNIMNIHAVQGTRVVYSYHDPREERLILNERYTVLSTKPNALDARVELKERPGIFFPCRLFKAAKGRASMKGVIG